MTIHRTAAALAVLAGLSFALTTLADPPDPDTAKWNNTTTDKTSRTKNNCYNYATDKQTGTFAQPGRGGKTKHTWPASVPITRDVSAAKLEDALLYKAKKADLDAASAYYSKAAQDDGLVPIADPKKAPASESVVALVVGYVPIKKTYNSVTKMYTVTHIMDHHWIRRNTDKKGNVSWSHKPGEGLATTKDNAGNNILNPADLITADESKSRYDRFVGYFRFKPDSITIEDPGIFLVNVPAGTLRVITLGSSGLRAGWCITSPQEINTIASTYLGGLPAVPPPGQGWHKQNQGFVLEAAEGTLGTNPGMWQAFHQVRITVRNGLIEVAKWSGGQIQFDYYDDVFGLETYLSNQPSSLIHADPCPASTCYPDCDGSGTLDLFDFLCFVNEFNSGNSYADCDGSGTLDLFDFLCFVNAFNAGCP